jgi:hypothetical protein
MDLPAYVAIFSGVSFLFYGAGCLVSPRMKREFIRFGYDRWRTMTGYLQLLGGFGLLVGFWYSPIITWVSASGLCIMMVYGFGVRIKIKDSLFVSSPAFIYAVINLYVAIHYGEIALASY